MHLSEAVCLCVCLFACVRLGVCTAGTNVCAVQNIKKVPLPSPVVLQPNHETYNVSFHLPAPSTATWCTVAKSPHPFINLIFRNDAVDRPMSAASACKRPSLSGNSAGVPTTWW